MKLITIYISFHLFLLCTLTLHSHLHVAPRARAAPSPLWRRSCLFRSGLLLSRRLLSRRLLFSVALSGCGAESHLSLPRSETTVRHFFNTLHIFLFQFISFNEKMYQLFWYGVAACFTATPTLSGLCLTRADRCFQMAAVY